MTKQDVQDFIIGEAKRLERDEHINDLAKAGRYEELKKVTCQVTREVSEYCIEGETIGLDVNKIPAGLCLGVAMFENATFTALEDSDLFENPEEFPMRIAEEAGDIGKNIAALMVAGKNIADISADEFFSDTHAKEWNN